MEYLLLLFRSVTSIPLDGSARAIFFSCLIFASSKFTRKVLSVPPGMSLIPYSLIIFNAVQDVVNHPLVIHQSRIIFIDHIYQPLRSGRI